MPQGTLMKANTTTHQCSKQQVIGNIQQQRNNAVRMLLDADNPYVERQAKIVIEQCDKELKIFIGNHE